MKWDNVKVNKVRKALGLSLAEMAAALKMTAANVHNIERGNYGLQQEHIDTLETEYGLTDEKVAKLIEQYDAEKAAKGDKDRALQKIKKAVG